MSAPDSPAGGPLLELLARLARTALAARTGGGAVRLTSVQPDADGATLDVQLIGMGGLLDTTVRLRVTIVAVEAERTRCALSLPQQGGLARLFGAGLQRLPPQLLQQSLSKALGDAVTLDGETLLVHHRALLRRLRKAPDTT